MVTAEILPFGENSHGGTGIEPETSWLVGRDSDH